MDKNSENSFDSISRKWKEKLNKSSEYEVVKDEFEVDTRNFISSAVPYTEYREALKLKNELIKRFEGKSLNEIIEGEEIQTDRGICYKIEKEDNINFKIINPELAKSKILKDLKLIFGIGEVRENILKSEGYNTIEDLCKHPRFSFQATKLIELLDECNSKEIERWITHWVPKTHPLVLCTSSFHENEKFVILDIESFGLFSRPIILIGIALVSNSNIIIRQYLLRDISEEPAVLKAFLSNIDDNSVFVTFNGKAFDLPYIKERLAYYGIYEELNHPHFDILHFSRRAWKQGIPNHRLTTLEKYLFGIYRKDDIPSALVPEFYEVYMRRRNPGVLIPIIKHNEQDLITLANIFSKLHEEWGKW